MRIRVDADCPSCGEPGFYDQPFTTWRPRVLWRLHAWIEHRHFKRFLACSNYRLMCYLDDQRSD